MAVTHAPKSKDKLPRRGGAGGGGAGAGSGSNSSGPVIDGPAVNHDDWPPQVELILSAIEAGRHGSEQTGPTLAGERRRTKRVSYRVRGRLRLFSDAPGDEGRVIYTRDIHARGLGFITPHRLPLGHGGVVELLTPGGKIVAIPCTLLRCREAAPGWYEGSVYFNREQHTVVPKNAG